MVNMNFLVVGKNDAIHFFAISWCLCDDQTIDNFVIIEVFSLSNYFNQGIDLKGDVH